MKTQITASTRACSSGNIHLHGSIYKAHRTLLITKINIIYIICNTFYNPHHSETFSIQQCTDIIKNLYIKVTLLLDTENKLGSIVLTPR